MQLRIKRNKGINIVFTLLLVLFAIFQGCHPAKHVPEDEYLLNRVRINIEDSDTDIRTSDLRKIVRQKPNQKTLSFIRFHLWVYNMAKTGREKAWKEKIADVVGEPPVIYDEFAKAQTLNSLKSYLESQGYYNSEISAEVSKRRRRATVKYNVKPNEAHIINKIKYNIYDLEIMNLIDKDLDNSLLNEGDLFSTDVLQDERERLTRMLKKNGYYYFSLNNIHYYVDTTEHSNKANITLAIRKSFTRERVNLLEDNFERQKISNVFIYTNYDPNKALENLAEYQKTFDTINIDGINLIYSKDLLLDPDVYLQACFIFPGDYYDISKVERSHSHYTNLRQFRLINIRMRQPQDSLSYSAEKYLDCHIYLSPLVKQSYALELEGMNTSGNIGASGSATYNNRNLLGGAERFSLRGSLALQSMSSPTETDSYFLNTLETTVETRLNIPQLLIPFLDSYEFSMRHNPETRLSSSFSYQQRPDYTRGLGTMTFGYMWKSSKNRHLTHFFNPAEISLVKIYDFEQRFIDEIDTLYIRYSYEDHLITVMSYDLIFNNQNIHRRDNFSYLWVNLETSGNLLNTISNSISPRQNDDPHKLLGLEFAQFVKVDIDYRYYHYIDNKRSLVGRSFFGIGHAYGNSTKGLPFIKKYFSGGANDLRAWQVRTLGPGSYPGSARFNQIADMKLVFNLEYRFPIVSMLEGALFLDAGNVWAIDKNDDREGALFEWDNFYEEIALGSGLGIRLDFSFFIIRFDFGVPLHDPGLPEDDRWLKTVKDFKIRDLTFNFGIGYPF